MSHSLRAAGREPEGSLQHSFSSTKFSIFSKDGLWQRMEREGVASEYRVDYVIGSGKHASGYLVRIGDYLFQSPLCYYTRLGRYDMAPGYEENRAPDFIRAVTMEPYYATREGRDTSRVHLTNIDPRALTSNQSPVTAAMATRPGTSRRPCRAVS